MIPNSGFKNALFKLVSSRVVFRQQHKDVSIEIQIAVSSRGVKAKVRPFDTHFPDYTLILLNSENFSLLHL